MPGCLVAMDGKHIHIKCSNLSGSNYYDYKVFYGMVLLAVCDSKYCFILHDTRQFSSNNVSGIPNKIKSPLAHSGILNLIKNNRLDILSPSTYKSCLFNSLPYFFVWDEVSLLKTWPMKPFPGKLTKTQKILRCRSSRGRRTIEKTIGILVARGQIVHAPVPASGENV